MRINAAIRECCLKGREEAWMTELANRSTSAIIDRVTTVLESGLLPLSTTDIQGRDGDTNCLDSLPLRAGCHTSQARMQDAQAMGLSAALLRPMDWLPFWRAEVGGVPVRL